MTQANASVKYVNIPGDQFPNEYLAACSALFSNHYGVWSQTAHKPGTRIRLSANRIAEFLAPAGTHATLAWDGNDLVGYALEARVDISSTESGIWVTQLVVSEAHRQLGIAETMLRKIWGDANQFAWGLVTANPYAVRALEKATQRRCNPSIIQQHAPALHAAGSLSIPYIQNATLAISDGKTAIHTRFYSDHSQIAQQIEAATSTVQWVLGLLDEGEEWFAFTFSSQPEQVDWIEPI
jgi:hypothetical protein